VAFQLGKLYRPAFAWLQVTKGSRQSMPVWVQPWLNDNQKTQLDGLSLMESLVILEAY
jgi:hypothetical protein